jgi:2-oxoglutarate ferredoxin oxidoreductase subunit alpha
MGAVRDLRDQGVKVGLLRPITVWPYPYDKVRELAKNRKAVVSFEMSWGQMIEDVALATRGNPVPLHFVGKHGGMTFTPNEIAESIKKILDNPNRTESSWQPH